MMVHDIDGPGIPACGVKPKESAPKKRAAKRKRPPKGTKECQYNSGVLCDNWKCDGCGFNPERKAGT